MTVVSHSKILTEIETLLNESKTDVLKGLKQSCMLLRERFDHFDWVGFYFADFDNKTLHLKVFSGKPTDHTVIPFGKGICGQVAVSNQNFMVPDVNAQDNFASAVKGFEPDSKVSFRIYDKQGDIFSSHKKPTPKK